MCLKLIILKELQYLLNKSCMKTTEKHVSVNLWSTAVHVQDNCLFKLSSKGKDN